MKENKNYFEERKNPMEFISDQGTEDPLTRVFNGICIYIFVFMSVFFIVEKEWIALSILLISRIMLFIKLPNFYLPILIVLAIYISLISNWYALFLLIGFIISSSSSMYFSMKAFKKYSNNNFLNYSKILNNPGRKVLITFRAFIGAICLSIAYFSTGFISNICWILFLIIFCFSIYLYVYLTYANIKGLNKTKKGNLYDNAIDYLNLIKNDKVKIDNKEKINDYLDYFEHEKDITEKIKTEDPMTIIKEGMTEKQFYENGKLEMICEIDNQGTKNGEYTMYYEDGNIKSKGRYKNGFPDGLCTNYFQNGKISMESYFKEGILDGESLLYWETGQLQSKSLFKNGNPIGDPEIFFR